MATSSNNHKPPHKHHFIPQFWTKQWAGSDGLAQRFTNPFGNKIVSHRKHPAAIGWFDRLYEFPHYNAQILNFETLLFRLIDQKTSDLFEKLRFERSPNLNAQETETLAVFIMTLMHRSPAGISAMRELSKIMLKEVRADIRPRYEELRGADDPETVEEYEASLLPEDEMEHFSSVYRTVVVSGKVGQFLAGLHWRKIFFEETDWPLLLGDDPLIRTNGLAKSDGHVALPLTPRIAFIGSYQKKLLSDLVEQKRRDLIYSMNVQAVETARHFVVDIDERQSRFISNRFGRKTRPTLSEQSLKAKLTTKG